MKRREFITQSDDRKRTLLRAPCKQPRGCRPAECVRPARSLAA
jgi:hypothetical protein